MNKTIAELLQTYGEPLMRFKPHGKFTKHQRLMASVPLECVIFKIDDIHPAGLVVYSRYTKNNWVPNSADRYVIRELLRKK